MFRVLKQSGRLVYFVNFLLLKNQRLINGVRPYSYLVNYSSRIRLCVAGQYKDLLVSNDQSRLILSRSKYEGKKKKQRKQQDEESSDEEDEEEEDDDDEYAGKGSNVGVYNVKTLRIDSVLKRTLGISRSKIEEAFYQNKIRMNGEILLKKSQSVQPNDELDLIKGAAPGSSNSIVVGRVKILKIQPDPDAGMTVMKVWKSKSLIIDNYQDENAWREPTENE